MSCIIIPQFTSSCQSCHPTWFFIECCMIQVGNIFTWFREVNQYIFLRLVWSSSTWWFRPCLFIQCSSRGFNLRPKKTSLVIYLYNKKKNIKWLKPHVNKRNMSEYLSTISMTFFTFRHYKTLFHGQQHKIN